MSAAYGSNITKAHVELPYFPIIGKSKNGNELRLYNYEERFESDLFKICQQVVEEGLTYPFETMETVEEFRAYFLSYRCFVCVELTDGSTEEIVGGFYVKPNFPGRCDHVCNAGFVVKDSSRGKGIGTFMVPQFLQIARDLNFEMCMFNLVFVSNVSSMRLWDRYGFKVLGRLPKAGRLKGLGFVDAVQYYYDLATIEKTAGLK